MIRRAIRVLELPISLSLGAVKQGMALAGRIVGGIVAGGSTPEPPPMPPPEPPKAPERQAAPSGSSRRQTTRTERPTAARTPRRRNAAGTTRAKPAAPAKETETDAPHAGTDTPEVEPDRVMTTRIEALRPEGPTAPPETEEQAAPPEAEEQAAPPEAEEQPTPQAESVALGSERESSVDSPPDPHSPLNTPIGEPDPTEWPDPYDRRPDPRDPVGDEMSFASEENHTPTGAMSTSEPHPDQDPEAVGSEPPQRDRLDS